jgi:hypothetical protein
VDRVRLAVCGLSPFVSEIIRTLVEDVPFVEFVESFEASDDLAADFLRSNADVLVCARPEQEMSRLWRAAVVARPPLAVLNLSNDHARGRLYALYPRGYTVDELTEESLLDALQRHIRAVRGPPA